MEARAASNSPGDRPGEKWWWDSRLERKNGSKYLDTSEARGYTGKHKRGSRFGESPLLFDRRPHEAFPLSTRVIRESLSVRNAEMRPRCFLTSRKQRPRGKTRRMAILGFELEEIVRLLALAEASGLDEFIWEDEGRYIRIRSPHSPRLAARARTAAPSDVAPSEPQAPATRRPPLQKALPAAQNAAPSALPTDQIALTSPTVGTFYRAEKPGAPPLTEVGQRVTVGQTVGVIEAMKVFSEFQAEHAGVIVAIPAEDGQLVQVGTPLFILRQA